MTKTTQTQRATLPHYMICSLSHTIIWQRPTYLRSQILRTARLIKHGLPMWIEEAGRPATQ